MVKNLPANAGDTGLIPRWGKIPWRKKWQPTPVFLPGESPGQRSLKSYKRGSQKSHMGLSSETTNTDKNKIKLKKAEVNR